MRRSRIDNRPKKATARSNVLRDSKKLLFKIFQEQSGLLGIGSDHEGTISWFSNVTLFIQLAKSMHGMRTWDLITEFVEKLKLQDFFVRIDMLTLFF